MASKRCDNINKTKEVIPMMTVQIDPEMVKAYQKRMIKHNPELEEEPPVGDVTGAVMRHLAAHGRRMATA